MAAHASMRMSLEGCPLFGDLPAACCCCACRVLQASKVQFVNKVQQCFAVRAQVDSLLDIRRATFTRLTGVSHRGLLVVSAPARRACCTLL
jgi:hypothetical protein